MNHVAIDIGASGGTVFLGRVTPETFEVREVDRFDNGPVEIDGRHAWDLAALRSNVVEGLRAADEAASGGADVVGIDTWGLDFALRSDGEVLRPPTSYRDPDAIASRDALFERVDRRAVFDATGITHWNTPNSLWQLYTIAQREPELLERADSLLMMPQLLSTLLGGEPAGEITIASTTQMVDPERREWATDLLERLALPTDLLPPLEEPGRQLGPVDDEIAASLSGDPEIVTPASHDTAAAVAGLPLSEGGVFLNTGTWFVIGLERSTPLRSERAFDLGLANELGVDETVRLLKNVDGFFALEECREAWAEDDRPTDYETLLARAREAPARQALIDPDDEAFGIDVSMPAQIRSYCEATDQPVPATQGEIVRCLVDSLVAKTGLVFDQLQSVADHPLGTIHLGGGGVRNELFCQLLADATGAQVRAGPVEATAVGNVLTQALATGTLPTLEAGRRLVRESFDPVVYDPRVGTDWSQTKRRMTELEQRSN
jgi:rhamnulokinase